MESSHPPRPLRGRRQECEALDRFVDGVRTGHSRILVLRGEPGIGKTALLDYAAEQAADCRICRVRGAEPEMELAFAGLHQLCAPLLDQLPLLAEPQRAALGVAFGLTAGEAPDRFLVGIGVLSLLATVADARPLLCLVDDADYLDRESSQALGFVARRLADEPVGLLFAAREPTPEITGLPELPVEGLDDAEARDLLASVLRGPIDERVRERILAETRGNPLALLELPRGLTPAELAGGFGLPGSLPLPARIEETFVRRLATVPDSTQQLLLVAAAEPAGDAELLWRAAARLGLDESDAEPAREAGLLEVGGAVRFRHPLVRWAVYRAASPGDRRRAHRALAESTDAARDPDHRAWHRAHAALVPDADVARELEESAVRARARGGQAAAAAFLECAAVLTPSAAERARRALAAARAAYGAGDTAKARELIVPAAAGPLQPLDSALLDLLRGQLEFSERSGGDTAGLLLQAARRLEPLDVELARETYLEALWAAMYAGRRARGHRLSDVAEAARAAPPGPSPPRPMDLLLDGMAQRYTTGYAAAVPLLRSAVAAFAEVPDPRWVNLVTRAAVDIYDEHSWETLSALYVRIARESGALNLLPMALNVASAFNVYTGRFSEAEAQLEEADGISDATGNPRLTEFWLMLEAWRGNEEQARARIEASRRESLERGDGRVLALGEQAAAVLDNGLGHYDAAVAGARAAAERDELGFDPALMFELSEAAVRTGDHALAENVARRLGERAPLAGTDWALGVEAACRALVTEGAEADALYRQSVVHMSRSQITVYRGRVHLLYGEWLRRERRRVDAREQLRAAYQLFAEMGAAAFADRAEREIAATGEHARARRVDTLGQLTPQESRIAGLARAGHTNQEIGERLFISPRTVEYHLHKVFSKLDISSRAELKVMQFDEASPALPRR